MINFTTSHPLAGMTIKPPQSGEKACPPPATHATGESLAALAGGGQGEGSYMLSGELVSPRGLWVCVSCLWAHCPVSSVRMERRV